MIFLFFASLFGSTKTVVGSAAVTRIKVNNLDSGNVFSDFSISDYSLKNNPSLNTNIENGIWTSTRKANKIEESVENLKETFSDKQLSYDKGKGRKLKYKRTGLQFLMKTILALKIIMGIFLPMGILASKILSWKAVTLSLMAFMLAKILFLKNLLAGKNLFSPVSQTYTPPFLIQGFPNEFWKRQGESPLPYH